MWSGLRIWPVKSVPKTCKKPRVSESHSRHTLSLEEVVGVVRSEHSLPARICARNQEFPSLTQDVPFSGRKWLVWCGNSTHCPELIPFVPLNSSTCLKSLSLEEHRARPEAPTPGKKNLGAPGAGLSQKGMTARVS